MSRADFWCRVLGWVQIAGGAVTAAVILFLWELFRQLFMIEVPALSFLVWVFVIFIALPGLLAGLFTVLFANAVEQSRDGLRDQSKAGLRVVMALTGLWSAGVVGAAGFGFPPLGLFGILALASVGLAIMGPDWTADLFKQKAPAP